MAQWITQISGAITAKRKATAAHTNRCMKGVRSIWLSRELIMAVALIISKIVQEVTKNRKTAKMGER